MVTLTVQFPAPAKTVLRTAYETACTEFPPPARVKTDGNLINPSILLAHVLFRTKCGLVAFALSAKPLGENQCELTAIAGKHDRFKQDEGDLVSIVVLIFQKTALKLELQ